MQVTPIILYLCIRLRGAFGRCMLVSRFSFFFFYFITHDTFRGNCFISLNNVEDCKKRKKHGVLALRKQIRFINSPVFGFIDAIGRRTRVCNFNECANDKPSTRQKPRRMFAVHTLRWLRIIFDRIVTPDVVAGDGCATQNHFNQFIVNKRIWAICFNANFF